MAASPDHLNTTASQSAAQGAAEQPWVEIYGSRGFPEWLAGQRTSLAFSTYQTGKLFLIGTTPDRTLSIFERTFNRAMGMCGDGEGFWLGTKYQLWRFENALAAGALHQERDRLYVPRIAYTTGDIDLHDVAVEDSGRVVLSLRRSAAWGRSAPATAFSHCGIRPS